MVKWVVLSLFCVGTAAFAMELATPTSGKSAREYPELSLDAQVVYIGISRDREELKKYYGELPLNTIFFQARFRLPEKDNSWARSFGLKKKEGLEEGDKMPDFVPYESIKDAKEDDLIKLRFGDNQYDIRCKQMRKRNAYRELTFQDLRDTLMTRFSGNANHLVDGKDSLIAAKVVATMGDRSVHGENRSPFVLRQITEK